MKKLFTLIAITLFVYNVFAQAPQRLSYQAVIRNSTGGLVTNHAVGIKISILQGSSSGTAVYVETHTTTTNANGLATVQIGGGTVVSGTFATINWSGGDYYLKTETDPSGGTSYTIVGTSQLLSVPYALNSKMADGVADNSITSVKISDGTIVTADVADNTVSTAKLGNLAVSSDKLQNGAVIGAKIAQAGAASGQALKWNGTTWAPADDATGAGAITLPWTGNATTGIDSYAFTIVSTGQEIGAIRGRQTNTTEGSGSYGVSGESLSPNGTGVYAYSNGSNGRGLYANAYVAVRANGNYRGVDANGDKAVEGRSYSPTGFGVGGYSTVCGVYGESWNSGGKGVYGKSASSDPILDETIGVYGEAESETAYGVKGYASYSTGVNFGVHGESNSTNGYGVYGTSKKYGIFGKSTGFQGVAVGGEATSDNSIGVSGKALNPNGTGVYGEGYKQGIYGLSAITGVYGISSGYKGIGTVGEATGTNSVGLQGIAINSNSTGVWGEGDNQGVYGISAKITGKGVYGSASSATGANYGVYGETASSGGYGVYGKGPAYGIYGISNGINGFGVYGKSTTTTGYGIYGDAIKIGVYGVSTSTTGSGVYGEAQKYGVYGFATLSAGYGIYGESPKYGAYGKSTASTGRAVVGEAAGTSSIGVMGLGTNTSSTGVWGEGAIYDFYAAGPGENYGSASSVRWKRNIVPIPDPTGKIMAIRGVFFDWDTEHGGQHDVGMIAEEVGKVLPEIVVYEDNGVDASGMDYSKITPLLVEAIKSQQAEIGLLKERIEKLEKSISASAQK